MVRRLLLAVLFCLAAWMLAERTFAEPAGRNDPAVSGASAGVSAGASIATPVATPPIDTHPPEARWESLLPQGIGSGSSSRSHQPQLQAVDLPGGVSNRAPWAAGPRVDGGRDAARFRPPFLLHTPLLI